MTNIIIGLGSVGKRHLRNLVDMGEEVLGFDISEKNVSEVIENLGIFASTDIEECFSKVSSNAVAYICTPANTHVEYALKCAERKMDLFIEKPAADSLADAERLVRLIRENGLVTMVGCNMRFNDGLIKVKEIVEKGILGNIHSIRAEFGHYFPFWRPGTDYRKNYGVKKRLGGGIILDCIHELDYVSWLINATPLQWKFIADTMSDFETETEDICIIICRFDNRVLGEIHIDCIQKPYTRKCSIVGSKGNAVWDFRRGAVEIYLDEYQEWRNYFDCSEFDLNDMFIKELRYFLNCVRKRQQTFNSFEDALPVLTWALSMREAHYFTQ